MIFGGYKIEAIFLVTLTFIDLGSFLFEQIILSTRGLLYYFSPTLSGCQIYY